MGTRLPPPQMDVPDGGDEVAPPPPPGLDPVLNSSEDRFGSLAEVAIMPPPIAGDPWAPPAEANGSANGTLNGSSDHGVA